MDRKILITILILIINLNFISAQINDTLDLYTKNKIHSVSVMDSIHLDTIDSNLKHLSFVKRSWTKMLSSKVYKMTYVGVPLVVGGFIVKSGDDRIRTLRNQYSNRFNVKIDDYTQYAPGVALLALKASGVPSRSSWLRMGVSDAFSAALMGLTVNTIKHSINVERPDGSNSHSFPSGHTATAFMFATMLHKEYCDASPWISIGGYAAATYTGVSRILNNKHWLSDVMVGAGIGILSTELGYYFADLIFKDKGIRKVNDEEFLDKYHNPSFLGIALGINLPLYSYTLQSGKNMWLHTGANAGVEGAYFWSPYFGVGMKLNISSFPLTIEGISETDLLDLGQIQGGAYFSYPILAQLHIGAKALLGHSQFSKCEIRNENIGNHGGISFETGVSTIIVSSKSFNMQFFANYNICPTPLSYGKGTSQFFTLGSAAAINF